MDNKTIEQHESNVRSYSRIFPSIFNRAKGTKIWDIDGKEYLDFFTGAGALNYGHNHPRAKQAIINYLESDGVIHSLDMATEAKIRFIETFYNLILKPKNLNYRIQFTGPTGTNAVESALKIARLKTGRTKVVAFSHSFHGVTLGSLAVTSTRHFRKAAGVSLENTYFLPYDSNLIDQGDSATYLEKMITDPSSGNELPAAIIVETVQCEGGINIASEMWLKRISDICHDNGILLIVDDIQVGCGRTGDFFSFEQAGIYPDLVTLSKSISGYGLPMSLVLIKPDCDILSPGQHNGTFRGNNLAFVAADAILKEYWQNDALMKKVRENEKIITNYLGRIMTTNIKDIAGVRVRGMVAGIEFRNYKLARKKQKEAFNNGLILECCGSMDEVLKIMPPLNILKKDLVDGLEIIKQTVA